MYKEEADGTNPAIKTEGLGVKLRYFPLIGACIAVPLCPVWYTLKKGIEYVRLIKQGFSVEVDEINYIDAVTPKARGSARKELVIYFHKYGKYKTGLPYFEDQTVYKPKDKYYAVVLNTLPPKLVSVYSSDKHEYKE